MADVPLAKAENTSKPRVSMDGNCTGCGTGRWVTGVVMIAVCHACKHLIKLANRKGIYYKGLDILKPGVIAQPSFLVLR